MIGNTTPASPQASAGIKEITFFSATSISNISSTFGVNTEPFYIRAFNLATGDTVTVQSVDGPGSGSLFNGFQPLGSPIQLTPSQPQVRIDWPGRYRLVFAGTSVSAITVVGNEAAFGAQSIYGASTASGGGGGSTFVEGTIPVTVTGVGTSVDPYVVGVEVESNANWIAGTATGAKLVSITTLGATIQTFAPTHITTLGVLASAQGLHATTIGYHAGNSGLAIDDAVIIGATAAENVTGDGNVSGVVIGSGALDPAVCASGSVGDIFIGNAAGVSTTFNNTVAIGYQAVTKCTVTDSVAIGTLAGNFASAGSALNLSVAVGSHALNMTGPLQATNKCVAVGAFALSNALAGALSTSVGIGSSAGEGALSSGIYIGNLAGSTDANLNPIIIGNSVDGTTPLTASGDNEVILGNSSHVTLRTCGSVIAGGAISASDSRLKQNIKPLSLALTRINRAHIVSFDWNEKALVNAGLPHLKEDILKVQAGVIAQEFAQVFPECIQDVAGSDGELYKFVHYDRLVPHLMSAIQELSSRLAALEKKK